MRQRRFESLPTATPESVVALADDHPAIVGQTTLFPSTVVTPGRRDRLLIPGRENRKLGWKITKGAWKGMALYALTLTERMTCPASCYMLKNCYGNAMPFSRRNAPGPKFERQLEAEIEHKAREHPDGFVVRLHVLGDFYSVDYVKLWRAMLERHPELHIYGYTAAGDSPEPQWNDIASAIDDMNADYPDQSCIRWSSSEPLPGGTHVIDYVPESANVPEGIVCPAERETTACCATCSLCWEESAREKTIVFIKHGMGSRSSDRIAAAATKTDENGLRQVAPLAHLAKFGNGVAGVPPRLIEAVPTELYVDETYQRNLSRKSLALIKQIIATFNWAHYTTPKVVRDDASGRLEIVDGQHTAIAAATLAIPLIPVMLISAEQVADKARAFIAHNRDRIAVSSLQLHHTGVVAEDGIALEVERVCREAGASLLRMPPPGGAKGYKAGDTMALATIRGMIRKSGPASTIRVLRLLREAERAPLRADEIKALSTALDLTGCPDAVAVAMIKAWPYDEGLAAARDFATMSDLSAAEALAAVFAKRLTAAMRKGKIKVKVSA